MRKRKTISMPFSWKELFPFLGVIIVAYFGYLGIRTQTETPIQATQTAEAKLVIESSPTIEQPMPVFLTPAKQKNIVATVRFDYTDSPIDHGWNFIEGDLEQVFFESISDATVGKALKITTSDGNFYAIDYELPLQASEFGNFLDIIVKFPDNKSSLYTYVKMTNNNGDTSFGWLKFKIGKEQTIPSQKTTGEQEWLVYVYPEMFLEQDWVKMPIDLEKTVQETFGKDGWEFQKIIKLRVRGNLYIDSIEISEITAR